MTLKMIATTLLILIGSASYAQMPVSEKPSNNAITIYSKEFTEIINRLQLQHDTTYSLGGIPISDDCVAMMNANQTTGKVGEAIFKELTAKADLYSLLLEGGDVKRYCKKYSDMSKNQRALVWVLILTTMAHFESSCSEKASARGPNGTAYGYYQLHKSKEDQYLGGGACTKNSSANAVSSSRCTLSMLEKQMERSNRILFSNKSYWEVLRPNGPADKAKLIAKALTVSSLCNPASL